MILTRKQAVEFDPSKREHRDAVHHFLKFKTWGPNAPKFAHEHTNNMAHFVQEKLLMWYLERDAAKSAKKADKAVVDTQNVTSIRRTAAA